MYDNVEELRKGLYVNKKTNKVVYPIIKKVPGRFELDNIHWGNFLTGGNWFNLVIIACLVFAGWAYFHDTAECGRLLEDPCGYTQKFNCVGGVMMPRENLKLDEDLLKDVPREYKYGFEITP